MWKNVLLAPPINYSQWQTSLCSKKTPTLYCLSAIIGTRNTVVVAVITTITTIITCLSNCRQSAGAFCYKYNRWSCIFSPCFFRSGRWSRCAAMWLCSSQSLQKTVSSQSLSVCANCLWLVASPVDTKYPQLRKTHFHCHNTHECTFFLLKEPLLSQPPAALGGSCCRSLRDRESCVHLNLFLLSEGERQSVSTKNSFEKWFILRLFLHPQFGPSALFYSLKKKKKCCREYLNNKVKVALCYYLFFL